MNQPSRMPAFAPQGVSAQTDRFVHDRLPPADQWPNLRYDRPELQFPAQLNLVEELLDKATTKGFGQRPLLRSSRVTFSYAQAGERVNRIAQWLTEDMGLVPGNRVLLRGGNSIGMALCWLAVVKAGLVAVATMPLLRARELGDIIDKAQPRAGALRRHAAGGTGAGPAGSPRAAHDPEIQRAGRPVRSRRAVRRQVRQRLRPARQRPTTSP